jgi:hypothetical protein
LDRKDQEVCLLANPVAIKQSDEVVDASHRLPGDCQGQISLLQTAALCRTCRLDAPDSN